MNRLKLILGLFVFAAMIGLSSCSEDLCEATVCLNDGVCNAGICDCPTGYSGLSCETHCSSSIIGSWKVINLTGSNIQEVYVFTEGAISNDIALSVRWSGQTDLACTGTLSDDCSTYSYIYNDFPHAGGTINFDGAFFIDSSFVSTEFYLVEAVKE